MRTLLLIALLLITACKDKADPASEAEPPVAQEPPPAAEPLIEETPEIEAPPVLGESAFTIYEAKSDLRKTATWKLVDAELQLHIAEEPREAGPSTIRVMASGTELESLKVFDCSTLKADVGRIDLMLRGAQLHVLCINAPEGEDKGWTEGARFAFDSAGPAIATTGGYGGEGIVDPDTIDLDEGGGEGDDEGDEAR